MTRNLFPALCFLGVALCYSVGTQAKPPIPDNSVSAPLNDVNLMLVLTSRDGAAAVIFTVRKPNTALYKYRFESRDGKKKLSGKGKVTSATKIIKAGPIKIYWEPNTTERAWIYYVPEKVHVSMANLEDFDDRFVRPGGGKPVLIKKLDLRRFMKLSSPKQADKAQKAGES